MKERYFVMANEEDELEGAVNSLLHIEGLGFSDPSYMVDLQKGDAIVLLVEEDASSSRAV